jgi:hypothetical protein
LKKALLGKNEKNIEKKCLKNIPFGDVVKNKGGWRIVIPMPEAINFVDGRKQKH